MKAFFITFIAINGINVALRFIILSWAKYPREVKWTRGEDVLQIIGD